MSGVIRRISCSKGQINSTCLWFRSCLKRKEYTKKCKLVKRQHSFLLVYIKRMVGWKWMWVSGDREILCTEYIFLKFLGK